MSSMDRPHACVVLWLRLGALALAVWGLWPAGPVGDHPDESLAQAAAMQVAGGALVELVALGLWWLAPRLALGVIKATLPGAPVSVDVAATAFTAMGLWFAGAAVVQLMALPAHALLLKLIAQSGGNVVHSSSQVVLGFLPSIVEQGTHIAFGIVLLLNAKRLSAWLSPAPATQ